MSETTQAVAPVENPPRTAEFGIWIAAVAVVTMFAAGLLLYVVVRAPVEAPIALPRVFWFSTGLLFVSSALLRYAGQAAALGSLRGAARATAAAAGLGLAFLLLQAPGLWRLLRAHEEAGRSHIHLYGLVAVLVALHALHVAGGAWALAVAASRAARADAPSAALRVLRPVGVYWHVMALVWLAMFTTFALAR